jgi:tRNA 2-thiouridine synthesizing protein A
MADFHSHSAERIDARGRPCPLPILALAKAVRGRQPGDVVELWATDPAVQADLDAWCQATGHELLSIQREGEVWQARVRLRG